MDHQVCHVPALSARDAAKDVILKELGVHRVAAWCGVGVTTVYQWLSRGTEDEPIPPGHLPAILEGARAEGVEVDENVLWPAMAKARGVGDSTVIAHARAE